MRRPLCLLALVLLLAGPVAPAVAGADPSSPPAGGEQGKREDVQQKRSRVVSQIDLLKASDVDLQVEVNRLGNLVKTQEGKVAAARLGLVELESKLGGLAEEVDQATRDADAARHRAAERAVDAYMHPGIESIGAVIEAKDYDQAHRRRTLIGEVGRFDQEILQGHLEAQKALAARQDRLADAKRKASELRQEEEDALADVQAAQATQLETKRALEARIADFQQEANSLGAEEAQLNAVISQRAAQAKASPPPVDEVAAPATAAPATSGASQTTSAPTTAGAKPPSGPSPAATAATPAPTAKPATTAAPTTRPPGSGFRLAWPLSGPVTSPFGMRWGALHAGIDIGVPIGTPIHAAAAGTVFFCGVMGGYGNVVLIDHGNGIVSLYGHQNNLTCSNNQRVSAGQVIGYSGNTGHSTGPHLHFEVRRNGTAVDPMQYLG